MDDKELREILEQLRFAQTDSQLVEVKEAVVGLPTTMIETVSAFSNGSGGVIILGVSERNGFHPAPGFKAKPMADAMAGACRRCSHSSTSRNTSAPLSSWHASPK